MWKNLAEAATYLLRCNKHLIEETEPFEDENRALCFWDLLQSLLVQCEAVTQLHHHDSRPATHAQKIATDYRDNAHYQECDNGASMY